MKRTLYFVICIIALILEGCEPYNPIKINKDKGVGIFSISETKKVTFSKGNLQYQASTNTWRFAENQWDWMYISNENIDPEYNGWIDMFGWGTGNNPTNISQNNDDYSSFIDWGNNKIGNDIPNTWRTLTKAEWDYLIQWRTNADILIGIANLNGVDGIIILPDNWECPNEINFKSGFSEEYISSHALYQSFTQKDWTRMEELGAVFLPNTGGRYQGYFFDEVYNEPFIEAGYIGLYWSSTMANHDEAFCCFFEMRGTNTHSRDRYHGHCVRLVKDL